MSKLDDVVAKIYYSLDDLKIELAKAMRDARIEGFQEGFEYKDGKIPTDAEFRKAHKEATNYGEDYCCVVYARSKATAAKLLETDEDCVVEVGIGWQAYDNDGEIVVGYYMGNDVVPKWFAYGVYL